MVLLAGGGKIAGRKGTHPVEIVFFRNLFSLIA